MPFNSETASDAGKKSKRGKNQLTSEIRSKLIAITDDIIDGITVETLNNLERLQLLKTLAPYVLPRMTQDNSAEDKENKKRFEVHIINHLTDIKEFENGN